MRRNVIGNEDDSNDFNIDLDDEDFFKDLPEESKL
jgi:hypothetical protein